MGREDEGGEKGRGGTPQNESIFAVIQKVNMRLMFGGGGGRERENRKLPPARPCVIPLSVRRPPLPFKIVFICHAHAIIPTQLLL